MNRNNRPCGASARLCATAITRAFVRALLPAVFLPVTAVSQQPAAPPLLPDSATQRSRSVQASAAAPQRTLLKPRTSSAQPPGQSCKTYDFDGLPEQTQIPSFDGLSSPGWYAGISGIANLTNLPYGYTAAVFFQGGTDTLTFANPVESVQYYYATAYPTTLTAYDNMGNVVAGPVNIPSNWDGNPNYYDNWTQIPPLQAAGNVISSINIQSQATLNNFLGIDDLQVCQALTIASVEMTQAIQQYQTLGDLKNSLNTTGEPLVPIIAGKDAVMRIYTVPVVDVTSVQIEVSVPGANFDLSKTATLMPGCQPADQRLHKNTGNGACPSADYYFTAPSGTWTATINVTDPNTNALIEQESLTFKSRNTQALNVRGATTCDYQAEDHWYCGSASDIMDKTTLLAKIAPTNSVTPTVTHHEVHEDTSVLCPPGTTNGNCGYYWFERTSIDLSRFYFTFQSILDLNTNTRTQYNGIARDAIPGGIGGIAASIPGYAVVTRSSTPRFANNADLILETVAHEHGHALGNQHTNTGFPMQNLAPGCYNYAQDSTTNWPWKGTLVVNPNGSVTETVNGNNRIQSNVGLEVGFDVAGRVPLDPNSTYEILSYCSPRWVAPQRYKAMILNLGGGVVTTPSSEPVPVSPNARTAEPRISPVQPFWMISGMIPSSGPPQFDPLFQYVQQGDISGGSGTYSLVVQNSAGTPLFTQHFTPQVATTEVDIGTLDYQSPPWFTQLVPAPAGAAQIVLQDPNGVALGQITLGGVAPTVAITNPTANFDGTTPIAWTITDPDSSSFVSRVMYSPDNGTTWSEIGEVRNSGTQLAADFSTLPGTNGQGLIKVMVSDGVNTGSTVSPNFSIARKLPSIVTITSPAAGAYQPASDLVFLKGVAYDTDDGALSGTALVWSSNLQGPLGAGNNLALNLQPGVHTITLTATDSDGNSISASQILTITSQAPVLNWSLYPLTSPPQTNATCIVSSVSATPAAASGAPLALVQYSVDGGNTYTNIPLNQLPYSFYVPGTGFISMVVQAIDASGFSASQSFNYFNLYACGPISVPNLVGQSQANALTILGNTGFTPGAITAGASSTVAAEMVLSQSPAASVPVAPGSATVVNFVVSSGPQVAVPNVVGQLQAAAVAAIANAGLMLGTITNASSSTVPAGAVSSETPSAGAMANAGATVNLTVSTGAALAINLPLSLTPGAAGSLYPPTGVTASGGTPPYIWSATGLPAGLSIDPVLGAINGTPSAAGGPYSVTVTVTDSNSVTANKAYNLTVDPALAINAPAALPAGTVGIPYTTAVSAAGGSGSYNWFATGLPPGLRIGSNGTISGTPLGNSGSPYSVQIIVQDTNGAVASAASGLTIAPGAGNLCAITHDGTVSISDVQLAINQSLGGSSPNNDLNADGVVNVVDVEIVINAILYSFCSAG